MSGEYRDSNGGVAGNPFRNGARRPNVLTVLVDQLRYDVFSHRGHGVLETPHLDRLAAEGAVFTDAVCSSPLCGPSRAALLSGCHADNQTYLSWNREPEQPGVWKRDITTVDEALAAAGHHVEYHGKWHVGRDHLECYQNQEHIYGHHMTPYHDYLVEKGYEKRPDDPAYKNDGYYTNWTYRHWACDDQMAAARPNGYQMPHDNPVGVMEVDPEDTMTAWTVKKTIRFLESRPPEPFAATCSILHPHAPLIACEKYARMYNAADIPLPENVNVPPYAPGEEMPALPIPEAVRTDGPEGLREFIAVYYGLVKELDDWMGKLFAALEAAGSADDTLVVFTADHGELMGCHRTFSKGVFYEESLRVPLVVRYPRAIPAGLELDSPTAGVDIAPTILDYCGVDPLPQFQGRSLRADIEGHPPPTAFSYSQLGSCFCWRSSQWKRIEGAPGGPMLFNLKEDPYETTNLLTEEANR